MLHESAERVFDPACVQKSILGSTWDLLSVESGLVEDESCPAVGRDGTGRTSGALLDVDASEAVLELRAVDGLQALFGRIELHHD